MSHHDDKSRDDFEDIGAAFGPTGEAPAAAMGAPRTLVRASGLLSIVVYLALALVASAYYPASFTPTGNWLSDLGNRELNPQGAVLYGLAAITAGLLLLVFFAALGSVLRSQMARRRVFVSVAEACGLAAASALVITGVFSEDRGAPHSVASAVLFVSFGAAAWFLAWAFLSMRPARRGYGVFAFIVALTVWAFAVLPHSYWLEWLAVALLLAFVGAVATSFGRETGQGRS
jgi:hypothetical membrane protein